MAVDGHHLPAVRLVARGRVLGLRQGGVGVRNCDIFVNIIYVCIYLLSRSPLCGSSVFDVCFSRFKQTFRRRRRALVVDNWTTHSS